MWHLERVVKNYRKYFFVTLTEGLAERLGEELAEADGLEDCEMELLDDPDSVSWPEGLEDCDMELLDDTEGVS